MWRLHYTIVKIVNRLNKLLENLSIPGRSFLHAKTLEPAPGAVYFTNTGHARGSIFLWMLPRSNYLIPRLSLSILRETMDNRTNYSIYSISWFYANLITYTKYIILTCKLIFLNVNLVRKLSIYLYLFLHLIYTILRQVYKIKFVNQFKSNNLFTNR